MPVIVRISSHHQATVPVWAAKALSPLGLALRERLYFALRYVQVQGKSGRLSVPTGRLGLKTYEDLQRVRWSALSRVCGNDGPLMRWWVQRAEEVFESRKEEESLKAPPPPPPPATPPRKWWAGFIADVPLASRPAERRRFRHWSEE